MIKQRFEHQLEMARKHGVGNAMLALSRKAFLSPLLSAYGADKWHLRGFHTTNYKKIAVALSREVSGSARVVVEVGCGLGDIVSRVKAYRKFGYDVDSATISCARLLRRLRRPDTSYRVGSFDSLVHLEFESIDLLIAMGWLHYMPDEWIEENLRSLLTSKRVRYIMVDEFPGQRGRIETMMKTFGTLVKQEFDWQDGKAVLLFHCDR
ncbi:SAM-dependent methyltransferase [Streptosporangium album]|uniref:SAM-dependent methyltransferase n=1 Tax=Streptosporangium album TaxID=47479 RepID=A0A7W7RPH2_9ACTN|nr:class I SAM-dependent methyltransferase [Streptosporangium album]MBB4935779.1 SAM-dependent methyltransferase [Streptosporangium album]